MSVRDEVLLGFFCVCKKAGRANANNEQKRCWNTHTLTFLMAHHHKRQDVGFLDSLQQLQLRTTTKYIFLCSSPSECLCLRCVLIVCVSVYVCVSTHTYFFTGPTTTFFSEQGPPEGSGLDDFLSKIIDRYSDIKSIVMCSPEGNELISGRACAPCSLPSCYYISDVDLAYYIVCLKSIKQRATVRIMLPIWCRASPYQLIR